MRIVMLDGHTLNPGDLSWEPIGRIGQLIVHDRTPPALLLERARNAEILLTNKVPIDAQALAQLSTLKLICVTATGYNIIDVDAAREHGILVCNVPEYSTGSVAQFVFALLLELCNRVGTHDAAVHDGQWVDSVDWTFRKTALLDLAGRTIGIVGFGRIGQKVAHIARAFDMQVMATSTPRTRQQDHPTVRFADIAQVFTAADVVSLHVPQTPQTTGMVNRALLRSMKQGAFLINTARGGLINEPDLAEALHEGVIAGAALDVLAHEPMRPDDPLRHAPNCIITPHIAWSSIEARQRLMQMTVDNINAYLWGHPINVVNQRA
jgi:glycerate dehydrogenase